MKADISRSTFLRERHYSGVRMQQGRVQLDADWNEQRDIDAHLRETATADALGTSGGPLGAAAFRVVTSSDDLTADEKAGAPGSLAEGDFYITAGRYYVEGLLCENDQTTTCLGQAAADAPQAAPISTDGMHLVYLDLWEQGVTALEDERIREVALGGPDTATRSRVVWQVRHLPITEAKPDCLSEPQAWKSLVGANRGTLAARAQGATGTDDPCLVPAGAGYRRLENQLYRVEVHKPGNRGTATFKWSRDNGARIAAWLVPDPQSDPSTQLTVDLAGREAQVGFRAGQWVELTDDTHELESQPGAMVLLTNVAGNLLTFDKAASDAVDRSKFPRNPKVRRWDSPDPPAKVELGLSSNDGFLPLESGIEVKFGPGDYRTGDHWLIPARTAGAAVEWPSSGNAPAAMPPHGVRHRYARLALVERKSGQFTRVTDCRRLFPAVTELTTLLYLGGDGQSAMPDERLPHPIQVGVTNGTWPVAGAQVRFELVAPSNPPGKLTDTASASNSGTSIIVLTDAKGVAGCFWDLVGESVPPSTEKGQRARVVRAALLPGAGSATQPPIEFTASLSLASAIMYPRGADRITVRQALDDLGAIDIEKLREELREGLGKKVDRAGDTMTGRLTVAGGNNSVEIGSSAVGFNRQGSQLTPNTKLASDADRQLSIDADRLRVVSRQQRAVVVLNKDNGDQWDFGVGTGETADNKDLWFGDFQAYRVLVQKGTGRVGIGTTKPAALLEVAGSAKLQSGAAINEFSTDVALSDNSDSAVPTERAVRTFVERRLRIQTGAAPAESLDPRGQDPLDKPHRVNFQQAFTATPAVMLSIVALDAAHDRNVRVAVWAANVGPQGFDVVYRSWADTVVYLVAAQWIAFGPV